jgi:hypothetical protein
MAWDGA